MTSKNNRRKCIVPCCGYRKNASDDDVRSLFKCPKDANKAYSWAKQIPGISFLLPSHHVCENHFEDRFKIKEINVSRTRLHPRAIPTIFEDTIITTNLEEFQNIFKDSKQNDNNDTIVGESSIQDVVQELTESENLLKDIKKEIFTYEGESPRIKKELDLRFLKNLFNEVRNNLEYYDTMLPESWQVSSLNIDEDTVFAFSKECVVNNNSQLLVLFQKSMVINGLCEIHYSIHGKSIDISDKNLPSELSSMEEVLDIVNKFDAITICKGIYTEIKFYKNKSSQAYKDDFGSWRHKNCALVCRSERCSECYKFNQCFLNLGTYVIK